MAIPNNNSNLFFNAFDQPRERFQVFDEIPELPEGVLRLENDPSQGITLDPRTIYLSSPTSTSSNFSSPSPHSSRPTSTSPTNFSSPSPHSSRPTYSPNYMTTSSSISGSITITPTREMIEELRTLRISGDRSNVRVYDRTLSTMDSEFIAMANLLIPDPITIVAFDTSEKNTFNVVERKNDPFKIYGFK